MSKPSLTPHMDALENVIPTVIAACQRDATREGYSRVTANMTELIVVAAMRAIAQQRDLLVPDQEIFEGFCNVMANTIMSGCSTITSVTEFQSDDAKANLAITMSYIGNAIFRRLTDPSAVGDSTHYEYDNPDYAPGRA